MRCGAPGRPSDEPTVQHKIAASGEAHRAGRSTTHHERIVGIDGFRFVAFIAVIFSHMAIGVVPDPLIGCSMFAVPFFFVMAGFFFTDPEPSLRTSVARVCRRLLIPFAFWLALYLLWFQPPAAAFRRPIFLASLIIQGGPAYHLWFLPSLTLGSVMLLVGLRMGIRLKGLMIAAGFLYVVGMAFGEYYRPLTGSSSFLPLWNTRNGPCFGFPFMVAGLVIARARATPRLAGSLALFVAGAGIQAAEIAWLAQIGVPYKNELLVGTIPLGIGAFLVARNMPVLLLTVWLTRLGRYSLGLYSVHVLFLDLLERLSAHGYLIDIRTVGGCLIGVALVAAASSLFCLGIGQVRWLRPLVL